jgi:ferrochelatase
VTESLPPVDAVLLLSFGGPERPQDVMPFLENVARGRNIPRARLEVVAQHYLGFGGRSPINDECRRILSALEAELAARGPHLPLYWGNRNWHPLLADTVAAMARDGVRRAVAIATSAFSSYSSCRQYLEDIEKARAAVGASAPRIEKLPPFWNHAFFLETMVEHARAALGSAALEPSATRLVFTAHSIPSAMAARCDYEAELREASRMVALAAAPSLAWDLAWQSRSGPPQVPWLEPDVCDHLRTIAASGISRVVLVPIGFVVDHMEVVYDLDTAAAEVARECGIALSRAACAGADPRFIAGLRDLVAAHQGGDAVAVLGSSARRPFPCAQDCCLPH